EADQPAEGRPRDHRVIAPGAGAEAAVDQRLEGLDDELEVALAAATAVDQVAEGAVLVAAPLAAVGDGDDDGLDALVGEVVQRVDESPVPGKAGPRVEEVLAVVHVDDGVVCRAAPVARR